MYFYFFQKRKKNKKIKKHNNKKQQHPQKKMNNNNIRTIVIASTNKKKIQGVKDAFASFGDLFMFISCDTDESCPIKQPFSRKETLDMTENRCTLASKLYPKADIIIGIQNGIWNDKLEECLKVGHYASIDYEKKWDRACIQIVGKPDSIFSNPAPNVVTFWTKMVPVMPFMDKGKNGEWSNLEDPHAIVSMMETNRSRLITEAIQHYAMEVFVNKILKQNSIF
jgi:hypothetical protein